jgi:hypothetical protein
MSCLLFHLIGVLQPGKLGNKGHPKIRAVSTRYIGFPKNSTGLGFWIRLATSTKSRLVFFDRLIDVARERGYIVCMQTKEQRGYEYSLGHPSPRVTICERC